LPIDYQSKKGQRGLKKGQRGLKKGQRGKGAKGVETRTNNINNRQNWT
jgi:hypothetical protein